MPVLQEDPLLCFDFQEALEDLQQQQAVNAVPQGSHSQEQAPSQQQQQQQQQHKQHKALQEENRALQDENDALRDMGRCRGGVCAGNTICLLVSWYLVFDFGEHACDH